MQHDITVLAADPVRDRLTTWLREGNCLRQNADDSGCSGGAALITFLAGIGALTETVTMEFLAGLPRPLLWLQMSPLTEEDAYFLGTRAATAGVNYVHAPYFTDPGTQDRPACLVHQDRSVRDIVTSGPCAATLIDALSYRSHWVGPLGSDAEHRPEYDALADHALLSHGQPAL